MKFRILRGCALATLIVALPSLTQAAQRVVVPATGQGADAADSVIPGVPADGFDSGIATERCELAIDLISGWLGGQLYAATIGRQSADSPIRADAHADTPALQSWTDHAALGTNRFDGEWVGEMRTTFSSAPCGMKYRLEISVTQGAATGSAARGGERFTLYGTVSDEGELSWTATSGRGGATGTGMVVGDTARGDWEDDTGQCTGTFSIERTP